MSNPEDAGNFTSKPVEDDCKPELVVKSKPNIFAEVLDNGAEIPVILYWLANVKFVLVIVKSVVS